MSREVHTPRQRGCADQHQDLALDEELLHNLAVPLRQASMVDSDAELQGVLQTRVRDAPLRVLELVRLHLAELLGIGLVIRCHEGHDVQRCQARLPPRGHEDERGLDAHGAHDHVAACAGILHGPLLSLHRVVLDGVVAGLVHLGHARHEVLLRVALDVSSHRHGPHARLEVEEPHHPNAEPICNVIGVRQRGGQAHEADRLVQVARDVSHARHNDLQHWPSILAQQVDLIDDDQAHAAHVGPVLPVAGDAIPLLRRGHHDIGALQSFDVGREVARELHDALAELPLQPLLPILHPLSGQGLERGDVDNLLLWALSEEAEHRQLCHVGLATSGGCS
mmetsp:Transcript_35120/g.82096  ORF Transcript_35120/g.82096 Transcript_35120/m.82096 type:complete len:336 (+) Transcript_35120:1621-2628(+)